MAATHTRTETEGPARPVARPLPMATFARDGSIAANLDLIRGLSALAVLLGHQRNLFFVDYSRVEHKSLLVKAFYFLTGYGHEAVMVFFVLSGFLVGSSVVKAAGSGKWSWRDYSANRLSRLYVALLPALALGLALDLAGIALNGGLGAYGGGPRYNGMMPGPVADRLTPGVFAVNVGFVQTILGPTFGSNGPLWSLANEFWYYLTFPCLWLATFGRFHPLGRAALGSLGAAALWFVGPGIAWLFPVWLLGVLLAHLPALPSGWRRPVWMGGLAMFVAAAVASRFRALPEGWRGDWIVGLCFAALLYGVLSLPESPLPLWRKRFSNWISQVSYTMYVIHVPILFFIHGLLIGPNLLWQPGRVTALVSIATVAALLGFIHCWWWLFEKRTDVARRWLKKGFGALQARAPA